MRRPRYALLTGSATLITCFFAASYVNADIDRYYLGPALMAWTWLAILAAAAIELVETTLNGSASASARPIRRGDPALGALATARSPAWSRSILAVVLLVADRARRRRLASRPSTRAASTTRRTGSATSSTVVEPNAAILSWWSYSTPLWYAQRVQGERPDVAIIDDRTRLDENLGGLTETIDANLGTRPVYVIRADPREVKLLADRYELDYIDGTDASKLTRVIGLKGGAGS